MKNVELDQVTVAGELRDRLERSAENLLSWIGTKSFPSLEQDPQDYLWGTDFQGRWLDVMSRLARCVDVQRDELDRIAEVILNSQKPDGSFKSGDGLTTQFGHSRGLIGLIEYYRFSGDEKYLEAAKRLADRHALNFREFLADVPKTFFAATAIEGFVQLSEQCGQEKYLHMARDRIEAIKAQLPGPYSQGPMPDFGHAHSYLLTAYGILCYCTAIGDAADEKQAYLQPVIDLWHGMVEKAVWLSGGMPELLPNSIECDEPCASGDWLAVNLWLWKLTGEMKYLDAAERCLLNQLYFNQLPNGGFSSTCNIEQGFRGLEAWWCCSMHGPRSLCEAAQHIYTYDQDSIWVNLFMPATATVHVQQGTRVQIEQQTQYPRDGAITLHVNPDDAVTFSLKVRVPTWADASAVGVELNGGPANERCEDSLLVITHKWQRGDQVQVRFAMPMRVETDTKGLHEPGGASLQIDDQNTAAKRIGVFWGPLLLAVFRTSHGNDLVWVYRNGYNEVLDSGGMQGCERSCPEYVQIDGQSFNLNRSADAKGFGISALNAATQAVIEPQCVKLQWQRPLHPGADDIGNIETTVRVSAGLPVTLHYEQRLTINAGPDRPRTLTQALLAGVRFSTQQEQYHDSYHQIWRYEYPPVQVSGGDDGPFDVARDGDELANTGSYRMDNGVFRAQCGYSGDVIHGHAHGECWLEIFSGRDLVQVGGQGDPADKQEIVDTVEDV